MIRSIHLEIFHQASRFHSLSKFMFSQFDFPQKESKIELQAMN